MARPFRKKPAPRVGPVRSLDPFDQLPKGKRFLDDTNMPPRILNRRSMKDEASDHDQRSSLLLVPPGPPTTKDYPDTMSWIRHKNLFQDRAGGLKSVTFSPGANTKKPFAHDKDTGRFDSAGSMAYAEGVAKRNESRRQMLDTMKASGLFAAGSFDPDVIRKTWYDGNGVAKDLTRHDASRLYNQAFGQLKKQHVLAKKQADMYATAYESARKGFTGPRSWQDVMNAGTVASRESGPWGTKAQAEYDQRTADRIKTAILQNNKSEAARLAQVAQSRSVMAQEMREKEAQRRWNGSAQQKVALAQKNYEDLLLSMQADSLNRAGNAIMWNAKMAKAFGVAPLKLENYPGYDVSKSSQNPTAQNQGRGQDQGQGQVSTTNMEFHNTIGPVLNPSYDITTGEPWGNPTAQNPTAQDQPGTSVDTKELAEFWRW